MLTLEQEFLREVQIWQLINFLKVKWLQENKIIPSDDELRQFALMKLEPISQQERKHYRIIFDFYI